MKTLSLFLFCLLLIEYGYAQPNCPSPFSGKKSKSTVSNRYQIGLGLGFTNLKGDRKNANSWGTAGYLNLDYQLIEGLYIGARSQYGSFSMAPINGDPRQLDSRYFGLGGGVMLYPLVLMNMGDSRSADYSPGIRFLRSLYLGADILQVSNKFNTIYRAPALGGNSYGPIDHFDSNGMPVFKEKVKSTMLPSLNIGLAPILNKNSSSAHTFRLVFNAQFNFANNDELDGYTPIDSNNEKISLGNDFYSFYSIGLRYSF